MESEGAKVMNSGKIANRWLVLTLVVFLAVAVSGAALSAELSGDEIYTVAQGEVVDDDLYIGANEIYINGIVKGDLIAGAQYIEIGPTGVIEGDLWAGSNSVVVAGAVLDDLRVAGAGVEISGLVGDDAFLTGAGGPFDFSFDTGFPSIEQGLRISGEIGGDLFAFAGGAEISGAIGGDFTGGMGALDFAGVIGGDADIQAGEFYIDDAARIGGELKYTATEPLELPAGIARDIRFEAPEPDEDVGGSIVGAFIRWVLRTAAIVIGVGILGWLLFRFRPNTLLRPAAAIRANPLESGVYGLIAAVLLIFIPIASIVLVIFTAAFWGVLPAVAMFVFLVAASALVWFFSPLLTGYWLGEAIGRRLGGERAPFYLLMLGALLIVILGRIPILGWIVYLLSFLLALGGLLRSGANTAYAARPAETAAG